jgi:nitrate reductase delta subunit
MPRTDRPDPLIETLPSPTKRRHDVAATGRLKKWTRLRFALPADAAVMVSEMRCALPGCAPVETVVVFWTADLVRHRFTLFKPLAEVEEDDLPPRWFLSALVDSDGGGCECC